MPKDLYLFNTPARQKEHFVPINPGKVGLYTCGPTVYHYAHIGNLRTYVFEDFLVRALKRAGYEVNHVMNITDVGHLVSDGDDGEDKMEVGARKAGKTIWEIADYYSKVFFGDLEKLNVVMPQLRPKATDHVAEMIELIQALEKKGFTYVTNDGVYFETSKFPAYPNFAHLDVENLEAGKRVAMLGKHEPTDFALWKFLPKDKKRQQEWDSPWGKGFPGWHIECSAMAMKYLGETFDIHCGGIDHVRVHHTNEVAQSEAATGKRFSNFWLHGEFLNEDSGKMSKSKGETLTLSVLERDGFDPMDYRFLLLQAHYRTQLLFSYDALRAAQAGRRGMMERLRDWQGLGGKSLGDLSRYTNAFEKAVFDDLNMPEALSVFFQAAKDPALSPADKVKLALDFDGMFGLGLAQRLEQLDLVPAEIQALVDARDHARATKQWAESDRLRGELQAKGYRVDDTPKGTKVSK
ncbi:MAG: cysteine--tRNA ligase [Bdellovibrionota bacterium]